MAHNEFTMLKKLIQYLDDERNDIYLHIDKKTRYVNTAEISSWARRSKLTFVPRMKIYWGTYSIVDCELKMLKAAVQGGYDYYHLISGVDLPLQSMEKLHETFEDENSEFVEYHSNGEYGDEFEDKVKYSYPLLKYVGRGDSKGNGIRNKLVRKLGYYQWKYTEYQRKRGTDRTKRFTGIRIYKGIQWFSITHDFAEYLIAKEPLIKKMFRLSNGPDEFFVPTICMNSEFKDRIKNYAFRQIDWIRGGPYSYTYADHDELVSCDAFFARKVSYNNEPLLVEKILEKIHSGEQDKSHDDGKNADAVETAVPLISVIVPCYNVKDYLSECVESLVLQDLNSYEILLVDDGSTDGTAGIVDDLAGKYPNVRAIHKENGGLSSARNAGLDTARGTYIAFVDSDDLVSGDYLRELYDAAIKYHADIAVCGYEKFDNESGTVTFGEEKVISAHGVLRVLCDIYHPENVLYTVAVNKLYKAEVFRNYRFPCGRIHEDVFSTHRIIGSCDCIAVIPDALYKYRIRSGSITSPEKKQDIRHLDYGDGLFDRLNYMKNMYDHDLEKLMSYGYFRGLYELMVDYSDESFRRYSLSGWFRRRAASVLLTHSGKMYRETRRNFMGILLFPDRMRKRYVETRRREIEAKNA